MVHDAEIQKIAESVLATRFAPQRFLNCEAHSEEDFDGESVVRVKAVLAEPIHDPAPRLDATLAIRDELHNRGDDRYVYLDLDVPGDGHLSEEIEEDSEPPPETRQ
jgi:hypothetical protein